MNEQVFYKQVVGEKTSTCLLPLKKNISPMQLVEK